MGKFWHWKTIGEFGESWTIHQFSLPIFTDILKMYKTVFGIYTDCSLLAKFSSPTAFTCMVRQNFPIYGIRCNMLSSYHLDVSLLNQTDPELIMVGREGTEELSIMTQWQPIINYHLWWYGISITCSTNTLIIHSQQLCFCNVLYESYIQSKNAYFLCKILQSDVYNKWLYY